MLGSYKKRNLFAKKRNHKSTILQKPSIILVYENISTDDQQMKRSGRAVMALCVIHSENNPSLALYEDTNTGYCFSCGWTGDSFKLLMEVLSLSFSEAKQYAERNGLFK